MLNAKIHKTAGENCETKTWDDPECIESGTKKIIPDYEPVSIFKEILGKKSDL